MKNKDKAVIKVNSKDLVKGYKQMLVHSAKSSFKPILTTVNHIVKDNKLILESTDAHTLGKLTLDCIRDQDTEFAVPRKVIQAVAKLKNKELTEEKIILEYSNNEVKYIVNGSEFINTKTEKNYPNIDKIFPKVSNERNIIFNIRELKEFTKHVKEDGYSIKNNDVYKSTSSIKRINLRMHNNKLEVRYEFKDEATNEKIFKQAKVDCTVTDGFDNDFNVYINTFLLEKHINKFLTGNKRIILKFSEKNPISRRREHEVPIVIGYDNQENYVGILCPLRTEFA